MHAKIMNIDASKSLELEGAIHLITAKDVPSGKNRYKSVGEEDELIFAEDTVLFQGHPIGAIFATSREIAKKAAKLVVTIQDAIAAGNLYQDKPYLPLKDGEPEEAFLKSDQVIEGEFTTTRQEHFYEETLSVLVVPTKEAGEMKVYCPTPTAMMTQLGIANMLGIPANRVTVHVKRIGCNCGGKQVRALQEWWVEL